MNLWIVRRYGRTHENQGYLVIVADTIENALTVARVYDKHRAGNYSAPYHYDAVKQDSARFGVICDDPPES